MNQPTHQQAEPAAGQPWLAAISRQLRLGSALFWALGALAAILLAAFAVASARQRPPAWQLDDQVMFSGATGHYQLERDEDGRPFRWLSGAAELRLPLSQERGLATVRLQTGRNPGPPAAQILLAGGRTVAVRPASEPRRYTILITPQIAQRGQLALSLRSPVFQAPNDGRDLGMRLGGLGWRSLERPSLAARTLGLLLGLAALGLLLIAIRDWPRRSLAFSAPSPASPADQAPKPRLDFIDGLRGMAVMMVVIAHSWIHTSRYTLGLDWAPPNLGIAAIGVNLFMVLSGFCLAYPLIQQNGFKPQRVGFFFQRRFLRIAPPYYAAIGLFALLPLLLTPLYGALGVGRAPAFPLPTLFGTANHLLFTHNLVAGRSMALNGSFWSLELEVQFYLLFPILIVLARRYGTLRMVAGVLFATLLWRLAVFNILTPPSAPALVVGLTWAAPGRLFEFALGILAAVIVIRRPQSIRPTACLLGALAILAYVSYRLIPRQGQFSPAADIVIGLGFFLLVIAASQGWLSRVFTWRPLTWVGMISYSIYLTHEPLLHEAYRWLPDLQGWTAFLVYTLGGSALLVGVGWLFYRLVEAPSLTLGKRLAQRQGAQPLNRSEAHSAP